MLHPEVVATVAGQLMGGSHPDLIHETKTEYFVKMAYKLCSESEKMVAAARAAEPAPEPQAGRQAQVPNPPEGPGTQGY